MFAYRSQDCKDGAMNEEARERFAEIASLPDEEIILAEAALLIAAEMQDNLNVPHYLTMLADLCDRFERTIDNETPMGVSVNSLLDFIHGSEGFEGNVKDYSNPQNNYLNRVIDTKQGIPISLALIHIALGSRIGIPVCGINFPSHFLVSYGTEIQVIVDPFTGRILSKPDCATLLQQQLGKNAVLKKEYFSPATNKAVLTRLLENLKIIFWKEKAWDESKTCIDLQLLLLPNTPEFALQLGAVYEMQSNLPLARHTYTQVLQVSDDEHLRDQVSKRLLALEPKAKTLH